MRRWNGWGDDATSPSLPESAKAHLKSHLGAAHALPDATLEEALARVPASRLPEHPLIDRGADARIRHACGQSLPDWLSMRSGRFEALPDGVAWPESNDQVAELLTLARNLDFDLIVYGGGTSVAGHINPTASRRPVLTCDMGRMNALLDLDECSRIARFGAGVNGPQLEAQLRNRGYTLGHYPQSFEYSTLGGWVASRSSGQQSLRYGRIEQLFAGGTLMTFDGRWELPTFPASAAGPDLREVVLGSEGRLGVITEAAVRVMRLPQHEAFHVVFFPDWERGRAFCRALAQQKMPLSMLRLSNAAETATQLQLAGASSKFDWLLRYLNLRGCTAGQMCMLTLGITGQKDASRAVRRQALRCARQHRGVHCGTALGAAWAKNRFRLPYLREALWLQGLAVDTLETATDWRHVDTLMQATEETLRNGLADENEPVMVFTHLSHVYPQGCSLYTTYLYRCAADYAQTRTRWEKLKHAASECIVNNHGTISHQHGVGKDHAPYLAVEKGAQGMQTLRTLCDQFDPDQRLNPGTLLQP